MDVHLIGAGNSAGQAAMFFANHARTVTLIVRGDSLEKSMSQYLVNQVRSKANIKVALNSEVKGLHGDDHLTAIDIHDRVADAVGARSAAGSSSSSAPTPRPAGCRRRSSATSAAMC